MSEFTQAGVCPSCGALACHWTDPSTTDATMERVKALLWQIEERCHTQTRTHLLELVHEAIAVIVTARGEK